MAATIDRLDLSIPARPQRLHGLAAAISHFARLLCEQQHERSGPYLISILSSQRFAEATSK
jgi:hypothetical protein